MENAVEIIENKAVELVVAPMCNQILTVCRLPTVLAEKFSATFSHRSSERISCKVTPIVWQVIDDQTSDSPKSWAKTLKDTIVGTLLDHEIFKK